MHKICIHTEKELIYLLLKRSFTFWQKINIFLGTQTVQQMERINMRCTVFQNVGLYATIVNRQSHFTAG